MKERFLTLGSQRRSSFSHDILIHTLRVICWLRSSTEMIWMISMSSETLIGWFLNFKGRSAKERSSQTRQPPKEDLGALRPTSKYSQSRPWHLIERIKHQYNEVGKKEDLHGFSTEIA